MTAPTTTDPLKLLVVDDDAVDRKTVQRQLRTLPRPVELVEVEDLEAAEEALDEEVFDCVLLDLSLPDGSGLELLRRLQASGGAPAAIIVLTGHEDVDVATECLQAGAQDYLVKGSLNPDALQRSIRYARERFHLGHELQEKAQALERSNAELERFAYVASHDLQEPLRTLRSFGQRLTDRHRDQLSQSGVVLLDRMLGAAGRMEDLIRDLLELSRLARGKGPLVRVDLADVLVRVEASLAATIAESDATVRTAGLAAVLGVDSQLERLFTNLIGNALKFRHPDRAPEVSISAQRIRRGRRDRFGRRSKVDRLEIEVSDNGIGFTEAQAEEIFHPFRRLHGRTRYAGTGMGLSISKAIVNRHGGRISAIGSPGEGATFVFTLPAAV